MFFTNYTLQRSVALRAILSRWTHEKSVTLTFTGNFEGKTISEDREVIRLLEEIHMFYNIFLTYKHTFLPTLKLYNFSKQSIESRHYDKFMDSR